MNRPASPRVTILVGEQIIAQATRADSSHCMVADAIRAQIPNARSISVDLATIRWSDPTKGVRYIYLTPQSVQMALVNFDQGIDPEEFTFTLGNRNLAQIVPIRVKDRRNQQTAQLASRASEGSVPIKVGGHTPPIGVLHGEVHDWSRSSNFKGVKHAGKVRKFGLKSLRES